MDASRRDAQPARRAMPARLAPGQSGAVCAALERALRVARCELRRGSHVRALAWVRQSEHWLTAWSRQRGADEPPPADVRRLLRLGGRLRREAEAAANDLRGQLEQVKQRRRWSAGGGSEPRSGGGWIDCSR